MPYIPATGSVSLQTIRNSLYSSSATPVSLQSLVSGAGAQFLSNSVLSGFNPGGIPNKGGRSYNIGGNYYQTTSPFQYVDGIIFSNDTVFVSSAGWVDVEYSTSASSSIKGYLIPQTASIPFILYSNETLSTAATGLSLGRSYYTAVSSSINAYIGGGYSNIDKVQTYYNKITRISFSTETSSDITAVLSISRYFSFGTYSSTKGYWAGGQTSTSAAYTNEIDGIDFTTEAAVNPAAVLSLSRRAGGTAQSSDKAIFAGGYYTSGKNSTSTNEIDGIIFATEAAINPAAVLSSANTYPGAASSSTAGYFSNTVVNSIIGKYTFSSDTISYANAGLMLERRLNYQPVSNITTNSNPLISISNFRGFTPYSAYINYGNFNSFSFVFASEHVRTITISFNRGLTSGFCSSTAGYHAGGSYFDGKINIFYSTITKMLFSNEASSNITATLTSNVYLASSGNTPYNGYISGGNFYNGTVSISINRIDKINFASDTKSTLTATLAQAKAYHNSASFVDFMLFAGGVDGNTDLSSIEKLMGSAETISTLTATLSITKRGISAVNSVENAYFAGGFKVGFGAYNTIDKVTRFTNTSSTISATLSFIRTRSCGSNSLLRGYFFGGTDGSGFSTLDIDAIDFSNETAVAPITSALTSAVADSSVFQSGSL